MIERTDGEGYEGVGREFERTFECQRPTAPLYACATERSVGLFAVVHIVSSLVLLHDLPHHRLSPLKVRHTLPSVPSPSTAYHSLGMEIDAVPSSSRGPAPLSPTPTSTANRKRRRRIYDIEGKSLSFGSSLPTAPPMLTTSLSFALLDLIIYSQTAPQRQT